MLSSVRRTPPQPRELVARQGTACGARRLVPILTTTCARVGAGRITFRPKVDRPDLLFFWGLMQQQHTLAPLHLWAEAYLGAIPSPATPLPLLSECAAVAAAGMVYLGWNMLCWHVRQCPPYPVQASVSRRPLSMRLGFYCGCMLCLLAATVAGHWARAS